MNKKTQIEASNASSARKPYVKATLVKGPRLGDIAAVPVCISNCAAP
jgi:hypothetical protein